MNIETKDLEQHEVQLTIEVDPDRVDKAKHAAARRLSRQANIPGFRKGKAPYPVIVRYLGEGVLMEEVLEDLGPKIYEEAIDSTELDAGGPGELVDAEFDPLKLIFNVPLQPEVDLGNYRDVRKDFKEVEIEDEAVNEALLNLREGHAVLEPVDRPAEMGDVVTLDVRGDIGEGDDADELMDDKDVEMNLGDKREWPMAGLDEHIVGIAAEEERTFDHAFPEDYSNASLSGENVHFTVTCHSIKTKTLPEADDDFALLVGGDFETMLDLRVAIRENLQSQAEASRNEEYATAVMDAVVEGAAVTYAPSVLNRQVNDMLEEQKKRAESRDMSFEDYLKLENKSEEEIRAELEPDAADRLKRGLILGKVIEVEELEVKDEDIDEQIDRTAAVFGDAADEIRKALGAGSGRHSVHMDLLSGRAVEWLVSVAKGEEPTKTAEDATESEDTAEVDGSEDSEEEGVEPDSEGDPVGKAAAEDAEKVEESTEMVEEATESEDMAEVDGSEETEDEVAHPESEEDAIDEAAQEDGEKVEEAID